MTRIFEALQKVNADHPDSVLSAVLEKRLDTADPTEPAELNVEWEESPDFAPRWVDSPAILAQPVETPALVSEPVATPPLPAAPAPAPPCGIRTVSLNVSDKQPVFPMEGLAGEQYRIIRTKLIHNPKQPRMIAVVSPGSGDGKTVTSINLAASLSMKDATNVLLIDTDLRRAKIADVLGLPSEPGLANVLAGDAALDDAIVRLKDFPNLYVIPAGKAATNPGELLDSERWQQICVELRNRFHFLVLDTPPIGPVTDYELIQRACDGVAMVFRPDHTSRAACFEALKVTPKDKFLGVIINAAESWFLRTTQTYYYGLRSE